MNAEQGRIEEARGDGGAWRRWGPYLSERAWGTVREDYSADGAAWDYFPHEQARSRAYRWNEDGLLGICDDHQYLCFAFAFWNGKDPILKERLFGLSGEEGNHGEDVKEAYFYLDSTPTHSYLKAIYKYPHARFPYEELLSRSRAAGRSSPEVELFDLGVFDDNRYFDIFTEVAKVSAEDLAIRLTVVNRGPESAKLHVLPHLWFRNRWSWGSGDPRPSLHEVGASAIEVDHSHLGKRWLYIDQASDLLFTENETNAEKLFGSENRAAHVKDAFHRYVIEGDRGAVAQESRGTKACGVVEWELASGETRVLTCRLSPEKLEEPFGEALNEVFATRIAEADEFYEPVIPATLSEDGKRVMRQAFAGLLWSKQYYHFDVARWLKGDPGQPTPPAARLTGRNYKWKHLLNAEVISMPDKWEYPWYASWDLAFHCLTLSLIDPDFAKSQLLLLVREWYMHPNGQLPAYEWAFGDVNPPVHAWAALRVFQIDRKRTGVGDFVFLKRVFHKLLLNFTWWVNQKDFDGNNVFEGGFLGLDNIGVFDRSAPLPTGGRLEQADGTSWMGMYCLNLLAISLELAIDDPSYEDVAVKFLEHFLSIAQAMNQVGEENLETWDEEDGFYYDVLHRDGQPDIWLQVRSMVGLIPLFAVETLEQFEIDKLPEFRARLHWFLNHRPDLAPYTATMHVPGQAARRLLSIADPDKLRVVLCRMLDETEFLSDHGVRSLSKVHLEDPYVFEVDGNDFVVGYEPAECTKRIFGGNSNWRGPVWFPVNMLIIESLQKFDYYLGPDFKVEMPTGSGKMMSLWDVSVELSRRLSTLFLVDEAGNRPVFGGEKQFNEDPLWKDYIPFFEYFHGDTGKGLGASHQTGWTALVAKLLQQSGDGSSA